MSSNKNKYLINSTPDLIILSSFRQTRAFWANGSLSFQARDISGLCSKQLQQEFVKQMLVYEHITMPEIQNL